MAKSLKRIVESVKEELSQYKLSDDFPLDDEYLVDKANDCRASLIRGEARNGTVDDKFYQQFCCLEIECEKPGCTIAGQVVPGDVVVYYVELPSLIGGIGWMDIRYFGSMGFTENFLRKNLFGWMNPSGNLWTAGKPMYTIVGDRAYIVNLPTPGMKFICLVGLLYNPTEMCDYDEEAEYPVPSDSTLQLLMKKDILSTWQTPLPDPHNDGKFPDVTDINPGKKR